eukprot:15070610-Ditylum_brightwellii.AAC.1
MINAIATVDPANVDSNTPCFLYICRRLSLQQKELKTLLIDQIDTINALLEFEGVSDNFKETARRSDPNTRANFPAIFQS